MNAGRNGRFRLQARDLHLFLQAVVNSRQEHGAA